MHSIVIPKLQVDSDEWVDKVFLRRGEGGLATIDATIMNNGQPYDLTGLAVTFYAYDPSGRNIYESARVTNGKEGKVSYTVSKRLTNMKGDIRVAYFEITSGNNSITTQNIPMYVSENVDLSDEAAGEYESAFDALLKQVQAVMGDVNKALNDVESAVGKTNAAIAAANKTADDFTKATNDAKAAESGRVSAEANRVIAETNRATAENERASREQERQANENRRITAEQARESAEQKRVEDFATIKDESEQAINEARDAAKNANDAADRVDESIDKADKSADRANKAADRVDESIKMATDAAGEAEIAASVSNAATKRLNDAMEGFNAVKGTEIAYAIGDSSTQVPTTGWTSAQQNVPQGKFQWVRTITHFLNGNDTVAYAVAYQGMNGKDAMLTEINGMYWFNVEDDWLVVYYDDATNAPNFEIQDRMLYRIYETED